VVSISTPINAAIAPCPNGTDSRIAFPLNFNKTALPENDTDILKNNLVDQVTSTVRWRETMNFANELRVKKIIELGSGKVLTGIAKRMLKDVTAINIEVSTDFDQF
jgi:[acyl-carrier-protein] S-malonyltransferase